jgi:hypothetical protein
MRRSVESACAVFLVGVLAIAAAGCGGSDDDRLPPASPPSPTLSPTPTVDPLDAEVLAALNRYIEIKVAARTDPDRSDYGLEEVMTDSVAGSLADVIRADLRAGVRYAGTKQVVAAELIERNLEDDPPRVQVETCLDVSDYTQVDIDTGEVLARGLVNRRLSNATDLDAFPERHLALYWFQRIADDQWVVSSTIAAPEVEC